MNNTLATTPSTRIRDLNDAFRQSFAGGTVMRSHGVASLDPDLQAAVINAVRQFDRFDQDNDPYGEHDFGRVVVRGNSIFFKIDYYDKAMEYGSTDAADPSVTHRVLTIMLADEW